MNNDSYVCLCGPMDALLARSDDQGVRRQRTTVIASSRIPIRKESSFMRGYWLPVSWVLALSGCAAVSERNADSFTLSALAGQNITYQISEPASFLLTTPENSAVLMGRVAVYIRDGKKTLVDNNITDPAEALARGVANELERAYTTRLIAPRPDTAAGAAAAQGAGAARYSIQAASTNWGLFFSGKDKTQSGLLYMATVELKDLQNNTVIAATTCRPDSAAINDLRPRSAWMANQANAIKDALKTAVDQCVHAFKTKALAITN